MKLEYAMTDFSRGLNSKAAANLTRPDELTKADNLIIGPGYTRKRPGTTKYTTLSGTIDRLLTWRNGATTAFLANVGTSLYKDAAGTFLAVTGALSGALKDAIQYKNRSVQDRLYLCDGGQLKQYDGTSVSAIPAYSPSTADQTNIGLNDFANLTNFRAITLKGERLYALAHPTYKNRLHFTHHDYTFGYGTADYWPVPYYIDFGTRENDEITTIVTFRDKIILLGQLGIYALEGDGMTAADYHAYEIDVPSGCVAPNSVQKVDNYLFYLAKDGLYALYATDQDYVSAKRITTNIKELDNISDSDKAKAQAIVWNRHYLLSFPDGQTFALNLDLSNPVLNVQCWSRWTGLHVGSWCDNDRMYLSDGMNILYLDETVNTDNGLSNVGYDLTAFVHLPGEVNNKKLKKLWIKAKQYDVESSNCTVSVTVDNVPLTPFDLNFDTSGVYGESEYGEAEYGFQDVVIVKHSASGKGMTISVRVQNLNDEPFELYSITLQYSPKKA